MGRDGFPSGYILHGAIPALDTTARPSYGCVFRHAYRNEAAVSCRVAEGNGPVEATTTGSGTQPDHLVPIPARFAGDMRSG